MNLLKIVIHSLSFTIVIFFAILSNACYANKKSDTNNSVRITGMMENKEIYLSDFDFDFENAISNDMYLTTQPIAKLCIYSSKANDNFNITILSNKEYANKNKFILYNRRYGKVQTELRVTSTNHSQPIAIPPKN